MRRKIFALVFALFAGVNAFSQTFEYVPDDGIVVEDNNRDSKGRVVRGSYLTNKFTQNWQLTVMGGGHTILAPGNGAPVITPRLEVQFAKWITPTVGLRIGGFLGPFKERRPFEYMYNHSQIRNEDGVNFFRQSRGLNTDIIFSASNMAWGYRQSRRWNLIPYISGQYFELVDHDEKKYFFDHDADDGKYYYDMTVTGAIGFSVHYALNRTFSLAADIKETIFSTTFHSNTTATLNAHLPSVAAGFVINFGKKNRWLRIGTSQAPMMRAVNEARASTELAQEKLDVAQKEVEALRKELQKEIDALQNEHKTQEEIRLEVFSNLTFEQRATLAGFVSFFELGSSTLSNTEQIRLRTYVQSVLEEDPGKMFYLTGSADKGTGTQSKNMDLATRRARVIRNFMVNTLGVKMSQIEVRSAIVSDEHSDARIDRCVLVEHE